MRFGWITLNVRDMQLSLSFYKEVAGLKLKRKMNPMPGTEIAFLGFGDNETEIELIRNEKNSTPEYG
ncbi:MAG: VOC family protein, partial [Candidatus Pacearchaeota archaeon]|nr:VOC family protein [Candidatus Pacearchaeota archaeon]